MCRQPSQYTNHPLRSTKVMKGLLTTPAAKVIIGLLIGVGLLVLVSRFVNIAVSMRMLQQNLATPRGIVLALLASASFLLAFSIRGIRWKLFLNPIGKVSAFTAIRLFLISIFLNFLLPISSGEIAKAIILKHIAAISISRSLPTVAMDRSLDLLPALFLMAIVPLLGLQMDIKLWFVLGFVGGLFICLALIFDSLFAMLGFWTIGYPISFGTVIFGYTLYNMFAIFPTPPGQVGSNEAIGLLVFSGLLHLPASKVIAMFILFHPLTALLMCSVGLICLKTLGLTIPAVMKVQLKGNKDTLVTEKQETLV